MYTNEKITADNGHDEFKKAVNKPQRYQNYRQPLISCEQLCGRVSPCGNSHCSNYRGHKNR